MRPPPARRVLVPAALLVLACTCQLLATGTAWAAGAVTWVGVATSPGNGQAGAPSTLAAASTGSSSPRYRYLVLAPGAAAWTQACKWTARATCSFEPTAAGTWHVQVEGRDASWKKGAQASTGAVPYAVTATSQTMADFSIGVSPASVTLLPGGSAALTVTVQRSGGFAADVLVQVTGLTAGVSSSAVVVPATSTQGTLVVEAGASALSGIRNAAAQGSGGGLVRSAALAVAVEAAAAPAQTTVQFAGRMWQVKGGYWGPGPNHFNGTGAGVSVDASGRLHLKVVYQGGKWWSSEVWLPASLGYGTYEFEVASRADLVDPNLVAAPFLYQDDLHEIDVEFSRWQTSTAPALQYVVQPFDVAGNRLRFDLPLAGSATSTWRIVWSPEGITFQALVDGALAHAWAYQGQYDFVPGGERVHLNFWQYEGGAPTDLLEKEFVFQDFRFTPLGAVAGAVPPRVASR